MECVSYLQRRQSKSVDRVALRERILALVGKLSKDIFQINSLSLLLRLSLPRAFQVLLGRGEGWRMLSCKKLEGNAGGELL
jgi:hypothetical protein